MRANANKRRQTLTNVSKRRGDNASNRKQTRANVDKRKQMLTPSYIVVSYTPLCNPLRFVLGWPLQNEIAPKSSEFQNELNDAYRA